MLAGQPENRLVIEIMLLDTPDHLRAFQPLAQAPRGAQVNHPRRTLPRQDRGQSRSCTNFTHSRNQNRQIGDMQMLRLFLQRHDEQRTVQRNGLMQLHGGN